MPLTKVSEELCVGTCVLEGILKYHVNKTLYRMDLSRSRIFLDETSSKRGHRYITVIADADTKKIGSAISDFSKSFLSTIVAYLPWAEIAYNRFHLVRMANDARDMIRSKNQMNGSGHKWMRFGLLNNEKKLSPEEKQRIFDIKEDNQVIGLAYGMKESLIQLYDYTDISVASEQMKQ